MTDEVCHSNEGKGRVHHVVPGRGGIQCQHKEIQTEPHRYLHKCYQISQRCHLSVHVIGSVAMDTSSSVGVLHERAPEVGGADLSMPPQQQHHAPIHTTSTSVNTSLHMHT
jgi:hypothetical protein